MPDYESPNVDDDKPEKIVDSRRFDGQYQTETGGGSMWNADHKTITAWAKSVKRQYKIDPEIQERSRE